MIKKKNAMSKNTFSVEYFPKKSDGSGLGVGLGEGWGSGCAPPVHTLSVGCGGGESIPGPDQLGALDLSTNLKNALGFEFEGVPLPRYCVGSNLL